MLSGSAVPDGREMYVLIIMEPVILKLLDWVNFRIRPENLPLQEVSATTFCRFVDLFLRSQTTGLSILRTIKKLGETRNNLPSAEIVRGIMNNLT